MRPSPARLHLDLSGGPGQQAVVRRMLDFGAERADVGRGAAPGAVLADPEGNAFRVVEDGETHRDPGPIAALSLHSADPERDVACWAMITAGNAGQARPVQRHCATPLSDSSDFPWRVLADPSGTEFCILARQPP